MEPDSEKNQKNFHLLDDDDIFKTYKASPLKSREYQEKNSVKATNKKNDGHDFSGENDNEDEAFSFSNNNESPSKDLYDISYTKKSKTETQKKTNSLNESPLYNAKVNNKQEFYHPERQEKGFGQLDDREQFQMEKTKKKEYTKKSDPRGKSEEEHKIDIKEKTSHNLKTLYSQFMKKNDEYKNRWEFLHDMSRTQREALNIIREANQKEKDNDPNLTFKPKLIKNTKLSSNFYQRNKIWFDNKKEKIESKKKNDQDKDLEHCTFQPSLNDYNSKIINFHSNKYSLEGKGVEQFLRRQILARQAKEEKEALIAHLFFQNGIYWIPESKGNNITFPKEFQLGNTNMKCPSIKKDFQKALSPTKYEEIYNTQENEYKNNGINGVNASKYNDEKLREIFQNPNDIYMDKIPFGQAIRELHGELHKLDLGLD